MRSIFRFLLPFFLLLTACGSARKTAGEKRLPATRRNIIQLAQKQLGASYKWGGNTPRGFDCSGLVAYVYGKSGIVLPRTTAGLVTAGREVSLKKIRAADLLLFRGSSLTGPVGHVGIVVRAAGQDTEFIHSSSGQKGGGVIVSSLNQDYYRKRFMKAVNVIKE